jgi:hypothetical protein
LICLNEQVCLRQRGRINGAAWESWRDGIQANLSLSPFGRSWEEIKRRSRSFEELRRLEREEFKIDPKSWSRGLMARRRRV